MAGEFNIEIEYRHVPRLDSGSDESANYLDEYGYVVIKNALTEGEADKTVDLLWDYLEELGTGIDRTDPTTWEDDRWPTCAHGAILPSYGIGHSTAQWFVRGIPNVKKAFAKIWDTETGTELLTLTEPEFSITSASFSPDGKRVVTGSTGSTSKIWDAVDWTLTKEEFEKQKLEHYQVWFKKNAAKR